MPNTAPIAASPSPPRAFGRFALQRLLGKSRGTTAWLAYDPQRGHDVMLSLPRVQPAGVEALDRWMRGVAQAARLQHPNLTPQLETGVQDQWPFVVVDRRLGTTLAEWLAEHPLAAPAEIAGWMCDLLQGLAFVHEAGAAHLDLQLHHLLVTERGSVSLMALGVAGEVAQVPSDALIQPAEVLLTRAALNSQRALAERDVLACGVLLHRLLAGQPALAEPDAGAVIARLSPWGRDVVRLPRVTPTPVPEALRSIVNRCTSDQERMRYRSARTLLGALAGWRAANARDDGGPVALLIDRLRTVGHLPAWPGLAQRVARLTAVEGQRTEDMAEQVLHDMALSLELLRTLNSAQVQVTQIPDNGSVLTLRRAIALLGVNGVRRAANGLRAWPGPLGQVPASLLQGMMTRVHLAAHTAQVLRPAGYDAQVVYLITMLQNLGRLMLRYHFADEAEQIQQLMQPAPAPIVSPDAGASAAPAAEQPGLSEQAAAFAVLGVDVDTLALAVARQWGLGDDVLHMIRRLPTDAPVRKPDTDADMLRLTASAANEAVDAVSLVSAPRAAAALAQVAQRYGRVLGVTARDIQDALRVSRDALKADIGAAALSAAPLPPFSAGAPAPAAQGSLRARAKAAR